MGTSNIKVKILIKELCFGSLHMTKKSHLTLPHTSLWNKGDADAYFLIRKSKAC